MKRIMIFTLTLVLLFSACLYSASAEEDPAPIEVEYGDITVIFDGNTSLNESQRLAIVQMLAEDFSSEEGCQHHREDVDHAEKEEQQRNILCNLFGHKKIEEGLIVVEHCVRDEDPRCLENHGVLTTCSRCDYYNYDIHSSLYISCH